MTKREKEEIYENKFLDFDFIGASHNAFTSGELTAFHAHVLPEHIFSAIEILSDILRPALRTEDFEEERGVILEEIAMYEDNPFMGLYERMMVSYYKGHPLSHRVLGTKKNGWIVAQGRNVKLLFQSIRRGQYGVGGGGPD